MQRKTHEKMCRSLIAVLAVGLALGASSSDAGLVQYGVYDEAAVSAVGTLNVDVRNFSLGDAGKKEVALFTVSSAGADTLAAAIRYSPRPKGYAIDTTVTDAGSGMKTIKAVIKMAGVTIIFR